MGLKGVYQISVLLLININPPKRIVNKHLIVILIYCRWVAAESSKYDIERDVHIKDMQIHDLEMEVSDMRGKFILPKLKKVHNFKLMGGEE